MKFEHPTLPTTGQGREAIDERWYGRFERIGSFQAYEYLSGTKEYVIDDTENPKAGLLEQQRRLFFQGVIDAPKRRYPKLEKFDLKKQEQELLALKREIHANEQNQTVRSAYIWKINEKIAELRMLRATREGNDQRFTRYSEFIYGRPDDSLYQYTLFELSKKIRRALHSDNPLICEIAQRFKSNILGNRTDRGDEQLNLDDASGSLELISSSDNPIRFPQKHTPRKEELDKTLLDYQSIIEAFEEALVQYRISGWTVTKVENSTAISLNQETKSIAIPKTRKLTRQKLSGLIAHEIGVHVLRREHGERSRLRLLGLGLDRNGDDEGIAMFEEQKITGGNEYAGFGYYFAISLARGLDGTPRNFREVFDILSDYFILTGSKIEQAKNSSWTLCLRVFRGTTGLTRGACFTKDLSYRKGNIDAWQLVSQNALEVRRFSVGKYDPANPRHIFILDQIGITSENIRELESSTEKPLLASS